MAPSRGGIASRYGAAGRYDDRDVPNTWRTFVIARNPEAGSSLRYLLRLPLAEGPILKAADTWPRTARVYCHRTDAWPDDADIVEEVPVVTCVRRGIAIDLVLGRPRENRSQFVFTTLPTGPDAQGGRHRASPRAHPDPPHQRCRRHHHRGRHPRALPVSVREAAGHDGAPGAHRDYGILAADGSLLASVERKALADRSSLTFGRTSTSSATMRIASSGIAKDDGFISGRNAVAKGLYYKGFVLQGLCGLPAAVGTEVSGSITCRFASALLST